MPTEVRERLTNEQLLTFLEAIRDEDPDHCLKPRDVLDAARPKSSPIHDCFEWNQGRAAEAFRLIQAGQLIMSVNVEVTLRGSPVEHLRVKTYHYLPADRKAGRGYRHRDDIKQSRNHLADLKAELVSDLQKLFTRFRPFLPAECGRIEELLSGM